MRLAKDSLSLRKRTPYLPFSNFLRILRGFFLDVQVMVGISGDVESVLSRCNSLILKYQKVNPHVFLCLHMNQLIQLALHFLRLLLLFYHVLSYYQLVLPLHFENFLYLYLHFVVFKLNLIEPLILLVPNQIELISLKILKSQIISLGGSLTD